MIEIAFKAAIIILLAIIFWQDTKDRMVTWILYPLAGILFYMLNAKYTDYYTAIINTAINLSLIIIIVAIAYFYSILILKKQFVNGSIGIGDLLFFMFLPFAFSTVAFIILFVFSLLFSLTLHMYFKNKSTNKTVPLAGYMALFFTAVYIVSFFIAPKYLFAF